MTAINKFTRRDFCTRRILTRDPTFFPTISQLMMVHFAMHAAFLMRASTYFEEKMKKSIGIAEIQFCTNNLIGFHMMEA